MGNFPIVICFYKPRVHKTEPNNTVIRIKSEKELDERREKMTGKEKYPVMSVSHPPNNFFFMILKHSHSESDSLFFRHAVSAPRAAGQRSSFLPEAILFLFRSLQFFALTCTMKPSRRGCGSHSHTFISVEMALVLALFLPFSVVPPVGAFVRRIRYVFLLSECLFVFFSEHVRETVECGGKTEMRSGFRVPFSNSKKNIAIISRTNNVFSF